MNDIIKIVKSLQESGFKSKAFSKQLKMKQKSKWGLLGMLLGTLGASLRGNLLTGKGTIRAGEGVTAASQQWCMIRAGEEF